MMRESQIEKAVCDYAKSKGATVLKLAASNNKGQPDRQFLYKGRCAFIEFKAPLGRPTALQLNWLECLRHQGFPADWFSDPQMAKMWLNENLFTNG